MTARREDGTALVLVLGFALVALLAALTMSAAVDLHLERQRLWAVADAAALAAADAAELDPGGGALRLGDGAARDGAASFLAASGLAAAGVELAAASAGDEGRASVVVARNWAPPFLRGLLPPSVRVEAAADARVMVLE